MAKIKPPQTLKAAPLFRVWNSKRHGFGFVDERPSGAAIVEAWTGFYDKEGWPIYEQDILSVHHDWQLGWVRALVERHPSRPEFAGKVVGPDGTVFRVGYYLFADAYLEGNIHLQPELWVPAAYQFKGPPDSLLPRWWSDTIFAPTPVPRINLN
jgi:hypothetical protein